MGIGSSVRKTVVPMTSSTSYSRMIDARVRLWVVVFIDEPKVIQIPHRLGWLLNSYLDAMRVRVRTQVGKNQDCQLELPLLSTCQPSRLGRGVPARCWESNDYPPYLVEAQCQDDATAYVLPSRWRQDVSY